ncbi:MAG TPA: glycine betaine ABC transporter substrate-binding protein, partial [Candidatus Binatia bacterium]|nr:glycine betaine ABC transporter substrate-binding protein [Candidatus Binatia bacterium]
LVQLEDDLHYFPPYDAVPVVRQKALANHPELREVLEQLGGILSVEEMRELNYAVDGEQRQAKDVVREFLTRKMILNDR